VIGDRYRKRFKKSKRGAFLDKAPRFDFFGFESPVKNPPVSISQNRTPLL
jgi:hypothetical protein